MSVPSSVAPGSRGSALSLAQFERLTAHTIIDRFDHKNLNADCPEFDASRGGLNPSVETVFVMAAEGSQMGGYGACQRQNGSDRVRWTVREAIEAVHDHLLGLGRSSCEPADGTLPEVP